MRREESPDEELARLPRRPAPPTPTDPDDGVFSGMISPHPASTPLERGIQIAITTLAFPVILASFLTVGLLFARYVSAVQRAQGSLAASIVRAPGIANPLAWLAGSALFVLLATRALPLGVAIACAVAQLVILGVRSLVRARIRERVELEQALARRRHSL